MQRLGWTRPGLLPEMSLTRSSLWKRGSLLTSSSAARAFSVTTTRQSTIASGPQGAGPIDSEPIAVVGAASPVPSPSLLRTRSQTTEEGKNFGKINDAFLNCTAKGFFSIHGGHLHQGAIPANFNPLAERKPLFLKNTKVFASMVDIPAPLPWTDGAIQMWERMQPLESYKMDSVKRKRARKMNKHKHRKKLKETRFLRRKLKQA